MLGFKASPPYTLHAFVNRPGKESYTLRLPQNDVQSTRRVCCLRHWSPVQLLAPRLGYLCQNNKRVSFHASLTPQTRHDNATHPA